MKRTLSILSALAFATTLALADDKPAAPAPGAPAAPGGKGDRPAPEEIFKKLDTNGDGFISLDEFKAGPRAQKDPAKAEEAFKKMDTDGDGKLSLEEFKAGHHGGPGGHKPGGKPPEKPADAK